MKKKEGKDKDPKQKIDYVELINKNLHDFKMTFDYTGYQFTRLDLSVFVYLFSLKHLISFRLYSKNSNIYSISIYLTTQ